MHIRDILSGDIVVLYGEMVGAETAFTPMNLQRLRKMLVSAGKLIESEDLDGACRQLISISKKCDGNNRPLDFVMALVNRIRFHSLKI